MAEVSVASLVLTCMEPKGVPMSTLSWLPFLCSMTWQPESRRQASEETARVRRVRFIRSPTAAARQGISWTFAVWKQDTRSRGARFHGVGEKFMRSQQRCGTASFFVDAGLHCKLNLSSLKEESGRKYCHADPLA